MSTETAPRRGRMSRRIVTCVVASCLAATATVAANATAASAEQGASTLTQQYYKPPPPPFMAALADCLEGYGRPVHPTTMANCVDTLARPDPASPVQLDAFRFFTNCLSIAWYQSLDDLYPSTEAYEDHVNDCLGL